MTETEAKKPFAFRKLVALDVDGVLNSYTSGWTGAYDMPDAPNPGAMAFLRDLVADPRFEVAIVSSRLHHPDGIDTVKVWIWNHLFRELGERDPDSMLKKIRFCVERPPATVTIDDRAITFLGTWPSLDRLASFQPYYKKPTHLRADPETAVAQVDALMTRIGRVAHEVGCPEGVQALDWLEERARIGHQVATTAEVTIEKVSDEDMERIRAAPLKPGAMFALPPSYWSLSEGRLRSLLETAWDVGAATAYSRRDRADDYEADGKSDETIRGLDVGRVIERARKDDVSAGRPTVDGVPVMSADDLPAPERLSRYAAARGKSVDEVLGDPDIRKVASKPSAEDIERTLAAGRAL